MEPALGRRTRTYNAQFTPPVTPHHTTMRSWLCRVMRCELSRPDRPTSAFSVGVRPAVAPAVPAPPDTLRRRTHLSGGQADSVHTSIPDTTKRSCLCRVWCTGVNWTIALNVFKFSVDDSLELSEIQFTPPKRTRHRQDIFVVSGVMMRINFYRYDSVKLKNRHLSRIEDRPTLMSLLLILTLALEALQLRTI